MRGFWIALAPTLALACAVGAIGSKSAVAADVAQVPAYDRFLVVPLRVVVLTSKDLELADCTLNDAAIGLALAELNRIWEKAGIRFLADPIVREPAEQVARFNEYVKLTGGEFPSIDPFGYLVPPPGRPFEGLRVAIFRELPTNGGYILGADLAIVQQDPQLQEVEGGSAVPLGRVIARALGQPLGLRARQDDEVGVMSNGTTGVGLSEQEVDRARTFARTIPGTLDAAAATRAAEIATARREIATAHRLWTALAAIPGAGAEAARTKLAGLPHAPVKP